MREYAMNDKICENMRDFEKYAKSHVPHLNSALVIREEFLPTVMGVFRNQLSKIRPTSIYQYHSLNTRRPFCKNSMFRV